MENEYLGNAMEKHELLLSLYKQTFQQEMSGITPKPSTKISCV